MKKTIAFILTVVVLLSLTACGSKEQKKSADLTALYESFQNQLPAMFQMNADTMMNFLGIDAADCVQVIAATADDGLRADEVWLIEAKDSAALSRIQALAQNRLAAKEDETVAYNPAQYEIVTKAQVVTEGLYLALLVSPDAEMLKAAFVDALK